jgi:hypothetical protein
MLHWDQKDTIVLSIVHWVPFLGEHLAGQNTHQTGPSVSFGGGQDIDSIPCYARKGVRARSRWHPEVFLRGD